MFAARGMGYFASTSGADDVSPQEDFSLPPPPGPTGSIHGTVLADGAPLAGVRVSIAGDGTPGVAFSEALTGADGTYTLAGVPQGDYTAVTADAPAGYVDVARGPVTVGPTPVVVDLATRRNFADTGAGAAVPGFGTGLLHRAPPDPRWSNFRDETTLGCGPERLFDSDQGTAVDTTAPPTVTAPRYVTVELATAVRGAEIWIDPTAQCGDGVSSSLGSYRISVSTDGSAFSDVSAGAFGVSNLNQLNPVPPNLAAAMPDGVRYVRLTALRSMGGPRNDSGFLGISELQVYGSPVLAGSTPSPTPQPTVSPAPTPPSPAPGQLEASLARTAGRLAVSRTGAITIKVGCVRATAGTLPAACRVVVTLTARLAGARRASRLARRTVTVAAGRSLSVRLKLSRAALRALRRHPLGARLSAAVGTRTATRAVRVRRR